MFCLNSDFRMVGVSDDTIQEIVHWLKDEQSNGTRKYTKKKKKNN